VIIVAAYHGAFSPLYTGHARLAARRGAATQIEEPLGRVTRFTRNSSGQLTQTITPAADTIDQTWSGPNLTQVRRRSDNKTVTMTYEATYNQLVSVSGDAEPVTNYWSGGRLDSVRIGSSSSVTKWRCGRAEVTR
jgi:YD repeat-containing protein